MLRTVYDVGEAHVRLQAPEGWVRLSQRGPRIVLRDPSCPTPLFVEPLPDAGDVDSWIVQLAGAGKRITGFQRSDAPDARRFVLTWTSRETPVERAYRIERVPSYRAAAGVWVAASIDLDGDRKRYKLLGAVFPHPSPAPQLSGEPGIRQYFEDDQRSPEGARTGPGYTLRLPRFHTIRDASDRRFLVHVHDEPLAWMTIEGAAKGPAAVVAEMEAWKRDRGASVRQLSDAAWLVDFPGAAPAPPSTSECLLSISLGDAAHVAITMSGGRTADDLEEFLRRAHRGFRPWSDQFRGHWQAAAAVSWADAMAPSPAAAPGPPVPAPAPVSTPPVTPSGPVPAPAPASALQAEWESRLSGAVLQYSSSGSAGYDPHASLVGYRKSRIVLYPTHRVEWNETVHVGGGYGLYMGQQTREHRSGRWAVEVSGATAQLVLYCGSEGGVHRLDLTATGVWLGARKYSLARP